VIRKLQQNAQVTYCEVCLPAQLFPGCELNLLKGVDVEPSAEFSTPVRFTFSSPEVDYPGPGFWPQVHSLSQ